MNTIHITQKQLLKFFVLNFVATSVAFLTGRLLQISGLNAPFGIIIGCSIAFMIVLINIRFAQRRPDEHFAAYGADIISRWLHYPLMMFVILFNIWIIVVDLWKIQDFLLQFYLLDTPPFIVIMLCGLCIAYTARFGVKSVFRAAEGLFYISLMSFVIIPFLVQSNVEWFMMEGFINHFNFKSAWDSGYYIGSIFGEMALLIYIYPYLSKPERTKKTILYVNGLISLLVVVHLIVIVLVIGPDLAANLNFPELEMIRLIRSGSYLETLDPIIITLWLITIFIKMSFMLLISSQILSKIFNLKHEESIIYPLATFVGVAAILLAKAPLQHTLFNNKLTITCFYSLECLPLLYYIIDVIRGNGKKKQTEKNTETESEKDTDTDMETEVAQ